LTNPSTGVGQASTTSLSAVQRVGIATLIIVSLSLILSVFQYFLAHPSGGPFTADKPECPHDRDTVWIAGKYTTVPEFHDCQRLIVKSSHALKYDSLAAAFLAQKVIEGRTSVTFNFDPTARVTRTIVFGVSSQPAPSGGGSGNRVSVPGASTTTFTVTTTTTESVTHTPPGGTSVTEATKGVSTAWVEVVADGSYPSLGIEPGFNCMFVVEHTNAGGAVLKTDAKMVKVGAVEQPCTDVADQNGTVLGLFANAAAPGATVPAVTRWVWSPSDSTQLIGIPCGTTWCDVGPHGGPAAAGSTFPQAIKGWYDEQILADYSSTTGTVVSVVTGTVFPEQGLEARNAAFYTGMFKDVAHVAMSSELSKYESRYAFGHAAATDDTARMAKVALCYGEKATCIPTGAPPGVCKPAPQTMTGLPGDAPVAHPWWTRVTSPDGTKVNYFCTGYRGLPADYKIAGAVRWRWRAKDETIWIPCAQGCCEVDVDLK
jgi:hypothetical protein